MPQIPILSIIVPCFNRREMTLRAVKSCLEQTYFAQHDWNIEQEYEILVVDDGSTDGTAQVVRSEFPLVKVVSQQNLGVSRARNTGIEAASGQWLAFLDSDDYWLPTKLEQQFALVDRYSNLIVHTNEIWIRNGVEVRQPKHLQKQAGMIFEASVSHCLMAPSTVLVHRSVIERVGLFDPEFIVCEDYDLWLRISARYPVGLVESPQIVRHEGHSDQLSRSVVAMDRYRVMALAKILEASRNATNWLLDSAHLQLAQQSMLDRIHILEKGAMKHGNQELQQWIESTRPRWMALCRQWSVTK